MSKECVSFPLRPSRLSQRDLLLVISLHSPGVVEQAPLMGAQAQWPSHDVDWQRRNRTRAPSSGDDSETSNVEWWRLLGSPTFIYVIYENKKTQKENKNKVVMKKKTVFLRRHFQPMAVT